MQAGSPGESHARAAVRTVVDSPLLDRQLAPMKSGGPPKGDLPIAFLQPEWKRSFSAKTQVVCLTRRTASKQRRKHGNLRPEAEPFACFLWQIKCPRKPDRRPAHSAPSDRCGSP